MSSMLPTLVQGIIWTHDGIFDWMIFRAGIITHIGKGDPPKELTQQCKFVQISDGNYIIPGLIDSHIHVAMYGEGKSGGQSQISLKECHSVDSLVKTMQNSIDGLKHWLIGHGWSQEQLGVEGAPLFGREIADRICDDKPVILYRNCFHLCVVNTFTLQLFGLLPGGGTTGSGIRWNPDVLESVSAEFRIQLEKDRKRADPSERMIDLDPTGKPTGIIRETMLFTLKKFLYMHLGDEARESFFIRGLSECANSGLTCVQTNDFYGAWLTYRSLVNQSKVPIRVFLTIPFDEAVVEDDEDVPVSDDQIGLVGYHRVKLFADGSLGAQTAALRHPYCGNCNHSTGILINSEQELLQKMKVCQGKGLRMEIHVIGDRATETVLNCLDIAGIRGDQARPILTHCQILGSDLIRKMKELNVIANVQPQFVESDAPWVHDRLGSDSERLKYSYAWKTLLKSGVIVSGGSDAPVEECSPFLGMHAAIFRNYSIDLTKEPSKHPIFRAEERLTFREAIDLYTKAGAYAAGEDGRIGELRKGFMADFVVIDQKIWESDHLKPDETWHLLRNVQVKQLWVNGDLVLSK